MLNKYFYTYADQNDTAYYLDREVDALACECAYHKACNGEQERSYADDDYGKQYAGKGCVARYSKRKTHCQSIDPMLIQGYGAGASVTAAGVFADIMSIANI